MGHREELCLGGHLIRLVCPGGQRRIGRDLDEVDVGSGPEMRRLEDGLQVAYRRVAFRVVRERDPEASASG